VKLTVEETIAASARRATGATFSAPTAVSASASVGALRCRSTPDGQAKREQREQPHAPNSTSLPGA